MYKGFSYTKSESIIFIIYIAHIIYIMREKNKIVFNVIYKNELIIVIKIM